MHARSTFLHAAVTVAMLFALTANTSSALADPPDLGVPGTDRAPVFAQPAPSPSAAVTPPPGAPPCSPGHWNVINRATKLTGTGLAMRPTVQVTWACSSDPPAPPPNCASAEYQKQVATAGNNIYDRMLVTGCATCVYGTYGASCNPVPGYPNNICSGHGTASQGISGTGLCTCYNGYSGPDCQYAPQTAAPATSFDYAPSALRSG
jgi:hypothetical protein